MYAGWRCAHARGWTVRHSTTQPTQPPHENRGTVRCIRPHFTPHALPCTHTPPTQPHGCRGTEWGVLGGIQGHTEAPFYGCRTFWPNSPPKGGPPWNPGLVGGELSPSRPCLFRAAANWPLVTPRACATVPGTSRHASGHVHGVAEVLKRGLGAAGARGGLQTDVPVAEGRGNHPQPTTMVMLDHCETGGGRAHALGTAQGTPVGRPLPSLASESAAKSTARGKQVLGAFVGVRRPFRAALAGAGSSPCTQPKSPFSGLGVNAFPGKQGTNG